MISLELAHHPNLSRADKDCENKKRQDKIAELIKSNGLGDILPTYEEYKSDVECIDRQLAKHAIMSTLRGLKPATEEFSAKLARIFQGLVFSTPNSPVCIESSDVNHYKELTIGGNERGKPGRIMGLPLFVQHLDIRKLAIHRQAMVGLPLFFSKLRELEISFNKFPLEVPIGIKSFTFLKRFKLVYVDIVKGTVPTALFMLPNLEELEIRGAKIHKLPEKVDPEQVRALKILHLDSNRLKSVPFWVFIIQNLSRLDLSMNDLESLPDITGECCNVEELDVSDNPNLRKLFPMNSLRSLKSLWLRRCSIRKLPEDLVLLEGLTCLDLVGNNIKKTDYPDFSTMGGLKTLVGNEYENNAEDRNDPGSPEQDIEYLSIPKKFLPPNLNSEEKKFFESCDATSGRKEKNRDKRPNEAMDKNAAQNRGKKRRLGEE